MKWTELWAVKLSFGLCLSPASINTFIRVTSEELILLLHQAHTLNKPRTENSHYSLKAFLKTLAVRYSVRTSKVLLR